MPHAIRIHRHGGPEVLQWEEVEVGKPGPGKLRIRHTAIGVNYVDIVNRQGYMRVPGTLGNEGAGVVEALGEGVVEFQIGDRVAYAPYSGSYCEVRLIGADKVVKLPSTISDQTAAAMMLRGMTVQYLVKQIHNIVPGDVILVHAVAGGVGTILCQWAVALGATVIGTVSTEEKAQFAKANGCHHVINYTHDDLLAKVTEVSDGKMVNVVYDGVGADTVLRSLPCLRRRGHLISFGQSSGKVVPIDLDLLASASLTITRASLQSFIGKRADLLAMAQDVFDVVQAGSVKIHVGQTYALRDAAQAHKDLEGRRTVGSTVLLP